MITSIIVAMDLQRGIGKTNGLLWRLPRDMQRFKHTTTDHPVIMGRKTHESIGKPLPNRDNIIVTRQKYNAPGCHIVNSLQDALDCAAAINHLKAHVETNSKNGNEVFIIGGGEIYTQALPHADRLYITKVHDLFPADTFFPHFDLTTWQERIREDFPTDTKNPYPISFLTYFRIK